MREIVTDIDIAATPEDVWGVLMDFAAYPAWNPFVTRIEGAAAVGRRLDVGLTPPGGKTMGFRPIVTAAEPERFFQWLGKVGFKGVFDGRHSFRLSPTQRGTRFEQSERFTGVLAGLILKAIGARTEAGFRAMNEALKGRCEAAG
ncbi:MAG: SRPBCC domain-containing protein [Actinobacteria bacterium]|nr:SRPBCC domain-containing protein [Actinomycetota bacterium]MBU1493947.1 SRPBCC domain-containing protein [Actinomycetota bacterium]MBU1866264.1 SRPBCC domain-containing protein [Actinomycetota bacterium]